MTTGKSDLVTINGTLRVERPLAILVDFGTGEPVWLPKSQVEFDYEAPDKNGVAVTMPDWLAAEKGIDHLVEPLMLRKPPWI